MTRIGLAGSAITLLALVPGFATLSFAADVNDEIGQQMQQEDATPSNSVSGVIAQCNAVRTIAAAHACSSAIKSIMSSYPAPGETVLLKVLGDKMDQITGTAPADDNSTADDPTPDPTATATPDPTASPDPTDTSSGDDNSGNGN